MEILLSSLFLISGLILLILSSGWLVQSSVKIAIFFKLTPLFIGLVIVAFGTSAPEAGVGIMAAIKNQKGIALGNIIGSNISNIGLILGLCSMVRPLKVDKKIFKSELFMMCIAFVLLFILCLDLYISRIDGLILITCFIAFCFISYIKAKKSFNLSEIGEFKFHKILETAKSKILVVVILLLSLFGVVWGADLMVRGGIKLAEIFKVSPWIIGITVFAIGTSLPELFASVTASLKNLSSISMGNILGSNIFNILFVLGIVSLIRPIPLDISVLKFELPIMCIFGFILFTVMRTGYKITRSEGLFMFLGYIFFIVFLIIKQ
ncbi:MAG: calcium/sodium antiporter [Candidatus Omnitrophica bacterium]|nr:calcium/sodium antiporter [Candidatus Omnitrophota bacterium]